MTGNPTDKHDSGMTQEEKSALFELRYHWADDYAITWINGIWVAVRREFSGHQQPDTVMLKTGSAEELKDSIQDDLVHWLEGSTDNEQMYRKLEQILQDARIRGMRVSVTSDEVGRHHLEVETR